MNVLLLHLPHVRSSLLNRYTIEEPLAHLYVGSVLAGDHDLRFVDLRLQRLRRALGGFRPQAAVVGVNPMNQPALDPALVELKRMFPQIKILLVPEVEYGNGHVIEQPQDYLDPLADAAVGANFFIVTLKAVVPEVLGRWAAGRGLDDVTGLWVQGAADCERAARRWRATPNRPAPDNVVDLGVPDRTILGSLRGRYRFAGIGRMASVVYSYGCKFKCRFCPMSKHDGSMSVRAVDEVIAELAGMTEPNVFLMDFEPFLVPQAMRELADALEASGIRKHFYMMTRADTALQQGDLLARWKAVGLRWLYLGLDGSTPHRLREIRKATTIDQNERALREMEQLGLAVTVGFPVPVYYDHHDFAALRTYLRKLRPPIVGFTVETPVGGTALFDDTESRFTTRDWSLFDLNHAVLPTRLPLAEFYHEMARLHLFGICQSSPALLRCQPWRNHVRNGLNVLPALWDVWHAARDHGPRRAQRAMTAQPVS